LNDVELRGVTKRYGEYAAVHGVSLEVRSRELLTLLGPSGCGKTTLLRIVTGFLEPDEGDVLVRGQVINGVPAHHRDTAMVYQSYALFPHMTIFENVAFGLRMRKVPRLDMERRVREALERVHLGGLAQRYPNQLSGGQQQRVALARALVVRPSVLLLDEPLSNLDAKLREIMRLEIRQLQREVGITTIFVTHDQVEALAMSDRIAVMNHGRIEQIGTPDEIYESPQSRFVMDFVGHVNLLEGHVRRLENGHALVEVPGGLTLRALASSHCRLGEKVAVGIRPERIIAGPVAEGGARANTFTGSVDAVEYLGDVIHYRVQIRPGLSLNVVSHNRSGARLSAPAELALSFDPEDCTCLPI
jgi:putative spermidine/putrescine transport system ATP-binding protein